VKYINIIHKMRSKFSW